MTVGTAKSNGLPRHGFTATGDLPPMSDEGREIVRVLAAL